MNRRNYGHNEEEDSPAIRTPSEVRSSAKGHAIQILPENQQTLIFSQTVIEGIRCLGLANQSDQSRKQAKESVESQVKQIMNLEVSNSQKMEMVCSLLEEIYRSIDHLRDQYKNISNEVHRSKHNTFETDPPANFSKHFNDTLQSTQANETFAKAQRYQRTYEENERTPSPKESKQARTDLNKMAKSYAFSPTNLSIDVPKLKSHHLNRFDRNHETQNHPTFGRRGQDNMREVLGLKYLSTSEYEFSQQVKQRMTADEVSELKCQLKLLFNDIRNADKFFRALVKLSEELALPRELDGITNNVHNLWRWIKDVFENYIAVIRSEKSKTASNYKSQKEAGEDETNETFQMVKAILERELSISRYTSNSRYVDALIDALRRHRKLFHNHH